MELPQLLYLFPYPEKSLTGLEALIARLENEGLNIVPAQEYLKEKNKDYLM